MELLVHKVILVSYTTGVFGHFFISGHSYNHACCFFVSAKASSINGKSDINKRSKGQRGNKNGENGHFIG